ncbi:hypothetical protein [Lacimicrobium sp. SS2-24]|uniref:hypothetical protein n=1 Tax=Lacimicrobium sp. SS2-24 TaxID=2005569 RepID=UPI001131A4DE|nr:hypothetical protein [Lacimicrobium sp. SS2-24]
MSRRFLSLLLCCCCAFHAVAESVLWVSPDNEGRTHKNIPSMGVKEATFALLTEAMPGLDIRVVSANNNRALQMLEDYPAACAGNKILSKDRAQRYYATTLPQTVFPGLRLYTREDAAITRKLEAIQQNGPLLLSQVLQYVSERQFGVVGGRRYSDSIDNILHAPKWQQKVWIRTASDMGAGMMDMLLSERIEAMLEHPNSAYHYHQQLNSAVTLHSFTVTEAPDRALGYILCSKTPQGKQLSEHFNQAISTVSQTPAYLRAHLDWLPQKEQDKAAYLQLYNQIYGTGF